MEALEDFEKEIEEIDEQPTISDGRDAKGQSDITIQTTETQQESSAPSQNSPNILKRIRSFFRRKRE